VLSIGMFTYSTKPRGSVVHATSLAEALARAGHDVTVYALAKPGALLYRPLACRVELIAAGEAPSESAALIRQRIAEFAHGFAARPMRHSVFHAQDCLAANALLASNADRIGPVVRTVHHVDRFDDPYLADCQRRSILDADRVLSVSRLTQREVLETFGRRSVVVHNGVDAGRFGRRTRDREWLVRTFGVGSDDTVVLSVGGVEPRKNTRAALAAVARVHARHPRLAWIIVGGDSIWDHGDYTARFESDRAELPPALAARVVRTGSIGEDDLAQLYRLSDVLLCTSLHEGFGLCVLESMAAGTAVVVPDREPFTEYLDERSAIFADPGSVESIARALGRLVFDPSLRTALASAARDRAAEFSWDRSATEHLAVYQALRNAYPERRLIDSPLEINNEGPGMETHHRVVVVGAGQAGLSVSYCLKERGIEHVVLERSRIASSWRSERWDTFCLVTPNWQCQLPGHPYQGIDPDGFMLRDEIVSYLESYAAAFAPSVREGVEVRSIECGGGGRPAFELRTSIGPMTADQVVIATSSYHVPRLPSSAGELPHGVTQIHSADYRNPAALPAGEVLVVGTGQSGCQIAEDLHLAGRRVHLCVGNAPRCARRHRGKDVVRWLDMMGYYDIPIERHPNKAQVRDKTNHYVTGRDGGRDIDLRRFALEGMHLYGPLRDIRAGRIEFAPGLRQNLDDADDVYRSINRTIDAFIEKEGIEAPEEPEYVAPWEPTTEVRELDVASSSIRAVVWCIGFASEFRWIRAPVFDDSGYPRHDRGRTAVEGLYFIGLPWLFTWGSGRFSGVGRDARHIASHIDEIDRRSTQSRGPLTTAQGLP
jgi:putative flavoprotein involved in K+ transport